MLFCQKWLKTNFASTLLPITLKTISKHHFSAPFTYTESLSKFEILTKIPRGYSMHFGQKRLKANFASTLLPITLKTISKHHFSAPFTHTDSFSKFEILTKIPRG